MVRLPKLEKQEKRRRKPRGMEQNLTQVKRQDRDATVERVLQRRGKIAQGGLANLCRARRH